LSTKRRSRPKLRKRKQRTKKPSLKLTPRPKLMLRNLRRLIEKRRKPSLMSSMVRRLLMPLRPRLTKLPRRPTKLLKFPELEMLDSLNLRLIPDISQNITGLRIKELLDLPPKKQLKHQLARKKPPRRKRRKLKPHPRLKLRNPTKKRLLPKLRKRRLRLQRKAKRLKRPRRLKLPPEVVKKKVRRKPPLPRKKRRKLHLLKRLLPRKRPNPPPKLRKPPRLPLLSEHLKSVPRSQN